MNKIVLYSIISFLVFSCTQEKINTSKLTIISSQKATVNIELIRPIDGMILWNNHKESLQKNSEGFYSYNFNISSPEIIRLNVGEERLKMIIQPNQSYQVEASDSTLIFKLDNAKGNELLNNLQRSSNGTVSESMEYKNDSTASAITQKVDLLKNTEIKQLDSLFENKQIDEEFYKIVQNEINYYYASKINSLIIGKSYDSFPLNEDLESLLEQTIEKYPVNPKIIPSNWFEYAESSTIYKNTYEQKKAGLITSDSLQKLYLNGNIKHYNEGIIRKHLKGTYQEKLLAYYIIFSAKQKNYEKSIIDLYDNFKLSFPNSNYSQYLEPEVNEIRDYQNKIKGDLPKSVTIIESDNIDSLNELLVQFRGQKIYIDLWASWCAPCKEEFSHNKEIQRILEEKHFKKLYISIDDKNRKNKWMENIKFHELNGYHFLSNKTFQIDFADNYTLHEGTFSIPQYLIVDEEGNIITKNAPRPSESNELKKMLTDI